MNRSRGVGVLFLVPVGAQAIITLGSIPIIIGSVGDGGWASIAAGQAVGSLLAVLCGLGWNVTGPSAIAQGNDAVRRELLRMALFTRLAVFLPLTIVGVVIVCWLGLPRVDLAVLGLATALVVALNMQWYFIGVNSPLQLVLFDSIPRIFVMTLGWFIVILGADVHIGLIGQIAASCVAVIVVCLKFGVWRKDRERVGVSDIFREVVRQRSGLSTQVFPALLSYSPMIAISVLAPAIAPLYALIDKVHKQLVTGLVPIGNLLIARLLQRFARGGIFELSTVRIAKIQLLGLGLCCSVGTLAISRPLIAVLSRSSMHLDASLVGLLSLLVGMTVVVALLPAGLMAPLGRLPEASKGVFWGVLFGVAAVAILTPEWGAHGALTGQIAGYGLAIMLQLSVLRRALKAAPDIFD